MFSNPFPLHLFGTVYEFLICIPAYLNSTLKSSSPFQSLEIFQNLVLIEFFSPNSAVPEFASLPDF